MGECWYCKMVKVGEICPRCNKAKPTSPELHNGFAMEQWQKIAELPVPIICEFWDHEDVKTDPGQLLRTLHGKGNSQFFGADTSWNNCRVVNKPNHWQPWFGGECPVRDDRRVLVYCGKSELDHATMLGRADEFIWSKDYHRYQIIAYMVLS